MKWGMIASAFSPFARRLSQLLNINISYPPEEDVDGLFIFGLFESGCYYATEFQNVPKLCYWMGSDVESFITNEELMSRTHFGLVIHLTGGPHKVSLLYPRIKEVFLVPIPLALSNTRVQSNFKPGILFYLSGHPSQDLDKSLAVIEQIRSPVYVMRGDYDPPANLSGVKNIIDLGSVREDERKAIFSKIKVFVRIMKNDSISTTVIEMKALGKQVFYNQPAPFCEWIGEDESTESIVKRIKQKLGSKPDYTGASWYQSFYDSKRFIWRIQLLCQMKGWNFPYG